MKTTRKQLKEIIKEEYRALLRQRSIQESYMSRLFGEIQNWVLDFNTDSGVVHVDDLIDGWRIDYPDLAIDQLWGVIEIMEDSGELALEGSSGYYRFTRPQIRESTRGVVLKEQVLDIIRNEYENMSDQWNLIANYAYNNDMAGALADKNIGDPQDVATWVIDEMRPWVNHVGDDSDQYMSPGTVVPDGWDPDKIHDFLDELERESMKRLHAGDKAAHKSAPNFKEREVLSNAFTTLVLPEDIPFIIYQIRRKAGQPRGIELEDMQHQLGHMQTWVDEGLAKQYGTTLANVIDVLQSGGAKLRKKRKPIKHTPPMYD